eukprot:580345-Rhodomonas_salina.2
MSVPQADSGGTIDLSVPDIAHRGRRPIADLGLDFAKSQRQIACHHAQCRYRTSRIGRVGNSGVVCTAGVAAHVSSAPGADLVAAYPLSVLDLA